MRVSFKKPKPWRNWVRMFFFSGPLKETTKYGRVLDLGCGWGFYFKINPSAWGVDFNSACIEYLRHQGYNVQHCDILAGLPFSDSFFDLILTHDVLEHFSLEEIRKIFKDVYRTLKKNGTFLIIIPNKKCYEYGFKIGVHKHFLTPGEIRILASGQFTTVKSYAYPLPRAIGQRFTYNKEVVILRKI